MDTTNSAQRMIQNANVYVYRLQLPSWFSGSVLNVVLGRKKSLSMVWLQGLNLLLPANSHMYSGVELRTPPRRKCLEARQYHVQFSVGGSTPRSTKQGKEKKDRASWDDNFYLCVHV